MKRMKRKKPLSIAVPLLAAFLLLTLSLIQVFAVPPGNADGYYIMVVPEETWDSDSPDLTPGNDYNITIYTNYDGSDIWQMQFELTFNPAVLQGVQVSNGIINSTVHEDAWFDPGDFDNTLGELSLTVAYFWYEGDPATAPTTSGPGILAYVHFEVIGYGSTDVKLRNAMLDDPYYPPPIIGWGLEEEEIGHGYFCNQAGDANWDHKADVWDLYRVGKAYGSAYSDPNWDAYCDFDRDLDVDSSDLSGLASNYGEWA
jgi:hypothetical protein